MVIRSADAASLQLAENKWSKGKFNATLDCFCGWPVGTLVDSMQGNPDDIPSKFLCMGIWTPSNTWFLRPS